MILGVEVGVSQRNLGGQYLSTNMINKILIGFG